MSALTVSDLVFSEQANHNFSKILSDLKRANLSITNRLRSIKEDSAFVADIATRYGLPLVANERCGSWYIDPKQKAASAYFKSTDGHMGQWQFSKRRLNLHLLDLIGRHNGCIIVDSTRRGKRMPDALSKTIPIWCCVLNRALFPDLSECHKLHVPPNVVSDSEASQIESRVPALLVSFLELGLDLASLRAKLQHPLRPIWRTQDDAFLDDIASTDLRAGFDSFHPVVCCTSSRRVAGAEMSEGGYIQGAGDDTENWAHGLTAPLFWQHADTLLATPESDLPGLISSLLANNAAKIGQEPGSEGGGLASVNPLNARLSVGTLAVKRDALGPHICLVRIVPASTDQNSWIKSASELEIGIGKHKLASRNLRRTLPFICDFVARFLASHDEDAAEQGKLVVTCESGRDLSVGVALALDCWCFADDGTLRPKGDGTAVVFSKTTIRVRLSRIMTAMPEANPSRTTLQSVNSFLMDWQR
ncbi:hypothetical protein VTK73DRAFT_3011 [Phialemonium thermophilum]|uniref:Initiator tRNA phosphoribosyl transferase n=1 Tax=Phialemonium thermophilum TaxID=223376 RepID=A0ABR3X1V7_9PEZI